MSNPSERRSGVARYRALCRSIQKRREASAAVASAISGSAAVSLRALLSALDVTGFRVYTSRVQYANVGLVRAIIASMRLHVADAEDD